MAFGPNTLVIETTQRCRYISFNSSYLGNRQLDQYTSLEGFLCLRPTVLLLKSQENRICRFRDRSSMTDELPVNQLDPVPDLSPNSLRAAPRTAGWLRWLRWNVGIGR